MSSNSASMSSIQVLHPSHWNRPACRTVHIIPNNSMVVVCFKTISRLSFNNIARAETMSVVVNVSEITMTNRNTFSHSSHGSSNSVIVLIIEIVVSMVKISFFSEDNTTWSSKLGPGNWLHSSVEEWGWLPNELGVQSRGGNCSHVSERLLSTSVVLLYKNIIVTSIYLYNRSSAIGLLKTMVAIMHSMNSRPGLTHQ